MTVVTVWLRNINDRDSDFDEGNRDTSRQRRGPPLRYTFVAVFLKAYPLSTRRTWGQLGMDLSGLQFEHANWMNHSGGFL
jgi:hypothetical protein